MERAALVAATVQPGGRAPASGALRLVQDFVNTVDREHGPDLLDEPAGLRDWLDHRGLAPGAPVRAAELDRARDVREALRAVLLANNGAGEAPDARAVLDGAGRRAGLVAAFAHDPPSLEPVAGGVDGALGTIAAAAFTAMLDGSWRRLKACPRDVCGWAFYDRSTNASATWCSMRVCGGRVKAGAYYRRRKVTSPGAAPKALRTAKPMSSSPKRG
jgi:predicted RNA-binding Zn ribbon-like protein